MATLVSVWCVLMIDLINFVVACVASFIVGMAFHSILGHEQKRHGWKFPWDHAEAVEEEKKADEEA